MRLGGCRRVHDVQLTSMARAIFVGAFGAVAPVRIGIVAVLAFGVLAPTTAAAQSEPSVVTETPGPRARITASGLELPAGRLWDAAEDELGYLWLASEAGLMLDGGASKAIAIDTSPLAQPGAVGATTSITASSDDGVWYADGTLRHLNPWTNERSDTGIAAEIVVDGPGSAKWAISGLDQVRLVDETGSIRAESTIELDHAGRRTNPAASTDDGTLYVGGGSTIAEVAPDGSTRHFAVTSEVTAVASGSDGSVLYSTLSGLWRLGPAMPRPEFLIELPEPNRGVVPTTALCQLADGTVLIGLGGGGLGVFDTAASRWVDNDKPLTDALIDLIFEQANGTVWLATDRGELLQYHHMTQFDAIEPPTEGVPTSLAWIHGALWAALGPDGVARFDESTRTWTRPISFERATEKTGTIPNVTALAEFDDDVWIATANEGVLNVAGSNVEAELVQGLTNQTADLQVEGDRLYAISARQTRIMGLDIEGRLAWELGWLTPQNRGRSAIATFANGQAYVVSHGGLGIFDTGSSDDVPIERFEDLEWAPWANDIHLEHRADTNIAWIGTDVGLVRLDLASGETKRLSSHDGLPSDTVTALLANPDASALWVGTNAGLSLVDLESEAVISSFGVADGLPDQAIRPVSGVAGDDGTGYLVTNDGVAVIPPEVPDRSSDPLSFAVLCQSGCGERAALDRVRNPNRFTVHLVSPEGTRARLMPIEYRLDAPDGDWEYLPPGVRTVSFGSLEPGTHRLEVRAANTSADEADRHSWSALTVEVDQVWWRRLRVQVVILVGVVSAAALGLWLREEQRRAHALELEKTIAARTRELEHSRMDAERANQAKNRFLMTVSHDLRSPLSGIVGFTELIAGTDLDERQRRYNDGVARSAKHLAELVEDLLYQSANATLATDEPRIPEPTMLQSVMQEAVEFVSAGASAHNIEVKTRCTGCEAPVLVDARGLKYVLGNLLANAINYSGGTTVHLEVVQRTVGMYEFSLADDGGSLDPVDAERVFEPGFRAPTVAVSGTGLGLSICQDWVMAHGGEITVEVQPRVMTRFQFAIKLNPVPVSADDAIGESSVPVKLTAGLDPRSKATGHLRIEPPVVMVVEDDEIVRDVLVTMLDGIGCNVWAFDCAEAALGGLSGRKWDLIFTDVMMQPTSGIEFARAVRSKMGGDSPPVAAITGVPDEASQAEIFDAVVNKPVIAQDLQRVIDRF